MWGSLFSLQWDKPGHLPWIYILYLAVFYKSFSFALWRWFLSCRSSLFVCLWFHMWHLFCRYLFLCASWHFLGIFTYTPHPATHSTFPPDCSKAVPVAAFLCLCVGDFIRGICIIFFFLISPSFGISERPLWKHSYSNKLKISPPKTESFQIKNTDIFHTRVLGSDYFSATFYQTYFYYKPSKYSRFTETHFCYLFIQSRKADK